MDTINNSTKMHGNNKRLFVVFLVIVIVLLAVYFFLLANRTPETAPVDSIAAHTTPEQQAVLDVIASQEVTPPAPSATQQKVMEKIEKNNTSTPSMTPEQKQQLMDAFSKN
jgi:hypothetical protein